MAHTYITTSQSLAGFNPARLNIIAHLRAWNSARKTRAVLSKLSPQVLDDIGLIPGDIERFR